VNPILALLLAEGDPILGGILSEITQFAFGGMAEMFAL
jgi:hypothetical protein